MAMGPEFIRGIELELKSKVSKISKISKIEGGDCWTALRINFDAVRLNLNAGRACLNQWLLFSWGSGAVGCCYGSDDEIDALKNNSPLTAPIAGAVKSRFLKGEIIDVRQINNDRVLEFKIRRHVAAGTFIEYFLVLEATEPIGNLLLLNSERIIEEAARHSAPDQNSFRTILPGHAYVPPPAFHGIVLDESEDLGLKNLNFEDVQNIAGIGRPLAKAVQAQWECLAPEQWQEKILNILSPSGGEDVKSSPCGVEHENTAVYMILNKNYLTRFDFIFNNAKIIEEKNILDAARHGVINILLNKGRDRAIKAIKADIKKAVKSRERHRDGLVKQLKNCETAEIFKRKGELILANIYKIPERAESVTLEDWTGDKLNIELDANLSPSKNADRYFKKYRKFKGDPDLIRENIAAVDSAIDEINEQLDILASINDDAKFNETVRDLKEWLFPDEFKNKNAKSKNSKNVKNKINKSLPPHLEYKINENVTVLVGLSARGNRYVTFKQARSDDIWLHAHELSGSHVIIKGVTRAELESVNNDVLKFAASLAAWHSKGKNSVSVLVDYTERRHVRAVPGTVALVTYTDPGTIRVTPENNI